MKKDAAKVFFQPSYAEKGILDAYCEVVGRSKTDVLREYIRTLPDYRSQVTEASEATAQTSAEVSNA